MLFNSFEFIAVFLPITLALYYLLTSRNQYRPSAFWLVGCSLFFYAYHTPADLVLLVSAVIVNFLLANEIKRTRSRLLVGAGVMANLLMLGYYKYAGFFSSIAMDVFGFQFTGVTALVLPLAISFFTFQQIAYLVDSLKREQDIPFLDYLLTVVFFPHLIAGPIVLYREMVPQLPKLVQSKPEIFRNFNVGMILFCIGLVKKLGIADPIAVIANRCFTTDGLTSGYYAWFGVFAYTMQIYFDFSGYSDMALGLSRIFNIKLPINFFSPYKSTSIIEFWRRWHISLSSFLRVYLYIPLGGSRCSNVRRYANLMITMLLGGLWHGAAWSFVIWGALHGSFLVINHLWRQCKLPFRIPAAFGWGLTFSSVMLAWIFFRTADASFAVSLIGTMFSSEKFLVPLEFKPWLTALGASAEIAYMPTIFLFRQGEFMTALAFVLAPLIAFLAPNIYQVLRSEHPALHIESFTGSEEPLFPDMKPRVAFGFGLAIGCLWLVLSQPEAMSFLYFQF